tara:strand:- start:163 stop:591 length:429 start_codon:yes stop_codon:yes gene_type:complete
MVNYQDSFIYKICCKDLTIQDIYIGSTTNFKQRKRQHKNCCTKEGNLHYNERKYKFIRDNGGWDNWDMILIKNVSCESRLELNRIERESYEEYEPTLNNQVPSRSKKEYKKEFGKELDKSYYERNKEKLQKKRMERYYNNKV